MTVLRVLRSVVAVVVLLPLDSLSAQCSEEQGLQTASKTPVHYAARLVDAAESFQRLRDAIGRARTTKVKAFREGLSADDLELFQGAKSMELEVRFAKLQRLATELAQLLSNDGNNATCQRSEDQAATDEASNSTLLSVSLPENSLNDEESTTLAQSNHSLGKATCKCLDVDDVERLGSDMEQLAKDLEAHAALVHRRLLVTTSSLPNAARAALKAAIHPVAVVATDSMRELTQKLNELNEVARQIADPQPRAIVRRLGAHLAQLSTSDRDEVSSELQSLSLELDEALVSARSFLETGVPASKPPGPKVDAEKPVAVASKPISSFGCTEPEVSAASQKLKQTVSGFKGKVFKQMLPPEVDNLNRVVHTLTVLSSTLMQQFLDGASALEADCARLYSGIHQLEADLAHYRSLLPDSRPATEKKKTQRPRSEPLKEGQLSPLELKTPTAGPGSRAGFGRQRGPLRPALDARSFR